MNWHARSIDGDGPPEIPPGYDYFRRKIKELTGLDLSAYKDRQMVRRLTGYMARVGMDNFFTLAKAVEKDPHALGRLQDYLTINVSEFFRNPERFRDLEKAIIPKLLREFQQLVFWSAGCSMGAEAYTISILLDELDPSGSHQILATDIDATILKTAEDGVFRDEVLKEVTPARRRRYFHPTGDGTWKIDSGIRRRVHFRVHDLLGDPYPTGVHLILCRNVVIYFTDEAKGNVFRRLATALVPGGYLLVGSTESVFNAGEYGLRSVHPFMYQKEGG